MVCRKKNQIVHLETKKKKRKTLFFWFMQLENFENVELTNDYVLEQVLMLDV